MYLRFKLLVDSVEEYSQDTAGRLLAGCQPLNIKRSLMTEKFYVIVC